MYRYKKGIGFIKWLAVVFIFASLITSCKKESMSSLDNKQIDKFGSLKESIDIAEKEYKELFVLKDMALKDSENQLYKNYSKEYLLAKKNLLDNLSKNIVNYDISELTEDEKFIKSILDEYTFIEKEADKFLFYNEPFDLSEGIHKRYPLILLDYPISTKEDVEEYLLFLQNIDEYFQTAMEFEKEKAAQNLFMSDKQADKVIASCDNYLLMPDDNYLATAFKEKLELVEGLSKEEKDSYISKNLEYLENDFVKAYDIIRNGIKSLKGKQNSLDGIYNTPYGKEYFEYLVYHNTGTSYESIDILNDAIEKNLNRDSMELAELIKDNRVWDDEYLKNFGYQDIYNMLESKEFDNNMYPKVEYNYNIKKIPESIQAATTPIVYIGDSLYINEKKANGAEGYYSFLEEAVPGHMYMDTYQRENSLSDIRRILGYNGYKKAWSTYAKFNISDKGKKDEILNLMTKREALQLGIYAYLDIQINYKGTDKEEVFKHLEEYYKIKSDDVLNDIYDSVIENPAKYLIDYVGYMEISEMKLEAKEILQDRFNELEFHKFMLSMGPAPFKVIRMYFKSWLMLR